MGPTQILPLPVWVDLGLIVTKWWHHTTQNSKNGASAPIVGSFCFFLGVLLLSRRYSQHFLNPADLAEIMWSATLCLWQHCGFSCQKDFMGLSCWPHAFLFECKIFPYSRPVALPRLKRTVYPTMCRNSLCNGFHRRKWIWRSEFESWMKLFAFSMVLIPFGNFCIQLFSLQLWVE